MRALDRLLRSWRIAKAVPHVRPGDRLLDVGCFDRSLIDRVLDRVDAAVGIDPVLEPGRAGRVELLRGRFPDETRFEPGRFDCVTVLAVLEHVEDPRSFAEGCARVLAPDGRVVLTVPHPLVDRILTGLIALRLADGMAAEEHHAFDLEDARKAFAEAGLGLDVEERFQLGLNRLFVFRKPAAQAVGDG